MITQRKMLMISAEQDKAAAKREKEERKAKERAEKEEAKARKSEEKRKSREQKKDEIAAVAGGAALAELAENVKDEGDGEVTREAIVGPKEPTGEAQKLEPKEELKDEPKSEPRDEPKPPQPREESKEEPNERASGRSGMFTSIRNKLKRRGDGDKPAEEPKRSVEEPKKAVNEPERKAEESDDESEALPDDDAAAVAVATIGTGIAAAGGVEEVDATQEDRDIEPDAEKQVEDDDQKDEHDGTAAIAGAAALGTVVAAGAVEMDRPKEHEDISPEVSSLSTEDDDLDSDQDSLKGVTTAAEHTGDYNFAAPSPALEKKPDLMRHISTIESSSGSEPEEMTDSDYEDVGRLEPHPTMIEQPEDRGRADIPVRDTPLVIDDLRVAQREQEEEKEEERAPSPVSPLSPPPQQDEGNIVLVNEEAPADAPHVVVEDRPYTRIWCSGTSSEDGSGR